MPRKHIKIVSRKLGTGFYLVVVCSFNETVYLVEDNWRPEAPQQKEKRPADERWSVWQWDPKGYPELKHAVTVEEIKQDPTMRLDAKYWIKKKEEDEQKKD